ncbi:alpha/beta hydrolase [Aphanothece hegewaldii CCALA 016]|uniref:Alpha/beta hydrolase n=1 Tax=Aphanothece hegewaldii CCALA 016 TaxID=2107694 RepID=A0A2T1LYK9_9CHRO|nr:alpha/beta hydrolase [Aphanothece hegewaldii]PSF37451.1 alpha/beta hydrolase [Aphanothece hegewaldii CCALA 016]
MPTIDIKGMPHTYELLPSSSPSSRPVLVFIHGWLLSRHYWKPIAERLSLNYPCLLYDLRGFGESVPLSPVDLPISSYSLAAYANDLKILLNKLDIHQVWLIGHSLGGSIALWGADASPEQVKGVICLNSGGGIYLKEEFERFRSVGIRIVKQRPLWLSSVPLIDLLFARMMVKKPLPRQWGKQRLIDFFKADQAAALGSLLESTTEAEVHLLPQVVARLQQPVYFLAGQNDQVMELQYIHHLASFHRLFQSHGGNVQEIPNCGHMAMLEQPDFVEDKITQILEQYVNG